MNEKYLVTDEAEGSHGSGKPEGWALRDPRSFNLPCLLRQAKRNPTTHLLPCQLESAFSPSPGVLEPSGLYRATWARNEKQREPGAAGW